eukprot:TRINITY_DN8222_c0_g1_i2.p1 TRINITY_DN8222_c0_g1~~TRINITY_DN8222_c0_g1_i2.p1  ORF type:complete len:258 (+),score=30.86 TRINITY_DN8222_c0_g1_i2:216-989(+)
MKASHGEDVHSVVAMGTGNKCLTPSKMFPNGTVLNDCHAEIIARRACVRFLWQELENYIYNKPSIFIPVLRDSRFPVQLAPGYKLHMYISHSPCGDASIVSAEPTTTDVTSSTERNKRKWQESCPETEPQTDTQLNVDRKELEEQEEAQEEQDGKQREHNIDQPDAPSEKNDVHVPTERKQERKRRKLIRMQRLQEPTWSDDKARRHHSGARCINTEGEPTDLNQPGYHAVGALRTKPGRGERTLSLSSTRSPNGIY